MPDDKGKLELAPPTVTQRSVFAYLTKSREMIKMSMLGLIALAALGCQGQMGNSVPATQEMQGEPLTNKGFYDFTMKNINGKEVPLSEYKGKVLLVVNVASQCGFTPQYEGLEKLYLAEKDKGFEVLGFPANEFGHQEPGTDEEIQKFCTGKFNVTFPMFSKIVVKGEGINPLYKWLLANADRHEDIEWNFCKFLISKDGKVLKRYTSKVTPESEELKGALEAALAAQKHN